MKWIALGLIRLYQRTLSPDHGFFRTLHPYGYCRFSPTCSQYGYLSIERFGVVRGSVITIWRILRCNPWSAGGIDAVPEKHTPCTKC